MASSWTKTVFDHTLITSQFLNDLQDYIMALEERIDSLETAPQFVPYSEDNSNQIPTHLNDTDDLSLQGVLIDRDVVVGDVFVGTSQGTLGEVTATDGQYATVKGIGERIP